MRVSSAFSESRMVRRGGNTAVISRTVNLTPFIWLSAIIDCILLAISGILAMGFTIIPIGMPPGPPPKRPWPPPPKPPGAPGGCWPNPP
jgi:hypothetical protein